MFECNILIPFPLKRKDVEGDNLWTSVAKFNFDPGLQVGDEFNLSDIYFGDWQDEPFSFRAMVVKREQLIKPQEDGDILRIDIFVEIADKEELVRMREIIMRLNPDKFKW